MLTNVMDTKRIKSLMLEKFITRLFVSMISQVATNEFLERIECLWHNNVYKSKFKAYVWNQFFWGLTGSIPENEDLIIQFYFTFRFYLRVKTLYIEVVHPVKRPLIRHSLVYSDGTEYARMLIISSPWL